MKRALMITIIGIVCHTAEADVTLPALFGDNMIFQRGRPFIIWGWADPDEQITVMFDGQNKNTKGDSDGSWSVEFPPKEAGGSYDLLVRGENELAIHDIIFGDVWVCSGQSNMQWPLRYSSNAVTEIAAANHQSLRLFVVKKEAAGEPRSDCEGQWEKCTFRTVPDFSAIAYHFGRELTYELGVPVGLIQSAWGGTPAETWTSAEALRSEKSFAPILEPWEDVITGKPPELIEYYDLVSAWFVYAFVCMGQKKPYGELPKPPEGYDRGLWVPSWLFNAMIAPLTSYPVTGIIWYQGESNTGRAFQYRTLFPALIRDWRRHWDRDDLPFLFVQLSNARKRSDTPSESSWAELREAQLMTLDLPATAMAVTIDIGEEDVHFRNKREAGRRLALAALGVAYHRDVVYSGPLYRSVEFKDGKAEITFDHTDGGLITGDGAPLRGFTVAGADSVFVNASAVIDGDRLIVRSDEVRKPVAVRYGWSDNPDCNLFNGEGLPASPFRTDDWPGITGR